MPFPVPYIAILDIGHGNSTILRAEEDIVIIDCGARSAGLMEFLKRENIVKIDTVIISHSDQDHIGGLVGLLASDEFEVKNVFINSDSSKGSALWDDLLFALSHAAVKGEIKTSIGVTNSSDAFTLGSIRINVIGPTVYLAGKGAGGKDRLDRTISSNSVSASFQIFWKESCVAFLAGDLDQIGLDDLVEHKVPFESPLLVFPHHGGKSEHYNIVNFTEQLCKIVNPSAVVFSMGRSPHDNPRPEVVDAVKKTIKNVRISCSQLSKNCSKLLPSTAPTHLADVFSRGQERNECCGGTFLIKLGEAIEYSPDLKAHRDFIATAAATALCN